MKHDTRTMIRSETGVVHFWRSHLPSKTFCGANVRVSWRVIDESADHEVLCLRCQEKDDIEGFVYHHGDQLPEPDIIISYCQCGHQKARHAQGRCLHCDCQEYAKGPIEPYLLA